MDIEIKFTGFEKVDKFTRQVAPDAIEAARKNAVNRVLSKAKTRSRRAISNASGVKPLKLLNPRLKLFRVSKRYSTGKLVYYAQSIPLEILAGKSGVQWVRGASVTIKGKNYPGTFAGTPRKGKNANKRKRVYKRVSRTGDNQKDLRPQYKDMKPYRGIVLTVARRVANQELDKQFQAQVTYQLKRMGYTN